MFDKIYIYLQKRLHIYTAGGRRRQGEGEGGGGNMDEVCKEGRRDD